MIFMTTRRAWNFVSENQDINCNVIYPKQQNITAIAS